MSESLQALFLEHSKVPADQESAGVDGSEKQPEGAAAMAEKPDSTVGEGEAEININTPGEGEAVVITPRSRGRRGRTNTPNTANTETTPSRPRRAASQTSYVTKIPKPRGRAPDNHYWDGLNGLYVPYGLTAEQFLETNNKPRDHYWDALKGLYVPSHGSTAVRYLGKSKPRHATSPGGSSNSTGKRKRVEASPSPRTSNKGSPRVRNNQTKKTQVHSKPKHAANVINGDPSTTMNNSTTTRNKAHFDADEMATDSNNNVTARTRGEDLVHQYYSTIQNNGFSMARRQIADIARNELWSDKLEILTQACEQLSEICQQDSEETEPCRRALFETGIHNVLLRKMKTNADSALLQKKGLEVLFHMSASAWPMADECLLGMGAVPVALQAMQTFPDESGIQVFAAAIFGNLATSPQGWKRLQEEATKNNPPVPIVLPGEESNVATTEDDDNENSSIPKGGALILQAVMGALHRHKNDEETQEAMAFFLDHCARVVGSGGGPAFFDFLLEHGATAGLVSAQRKFGAHNAAIRSRVTSFLDQIMKYSSSKGEKEEDPKKEKEDVTPT
eukprot:scaffold1060_cov196-Amphora_coffeaeformis.AAC.16